MGDEFVNWFDSSRTRFNNNSSSSPSSWATSRNNNESIDSSVSISDSTNNSMLLFQETRDKLQTSDDLGGGGGVLMDHSLQMMGLGLSSQHIDWNQSLFRSGKSDGRIFGSILEEDQHLGTDINYHQETGTRQNFQILQDKIFSHGGGEEESCLNQGVSITSSSNFGMDNSSVYENNSNQSTMLQGFLGSPFENNHQRSMDFYPNYVANYDMNNTNEVLLPKFSHFMSSASASSLPIQQLVTPQSQLHFSNNAKFWNASATTTAATTTTATMSDHGQLRFLPMHQQQFSTSSNFDEKSITSENKNSGSMLRKSASEVSLKRPRTETSPSPSSLPAFKVRKEKMGDRITALQQLVSPFGKTDTASVLTEAIDYIKFLHDQAAVLSTPYMKNASSNQHHLQGRDKSKDTDGHKQDLRSLGLCLVPISSTYPVMHETTVDFWTPTFGGTYR